MNEVTVWLALDLCPKPGTPVPTDGVYMDEIFLTPGLNGEGWSRDWKVFLTEPEARAYAASEDTMNLVVMPLILEGRPTPETTRG